jgi:hypothetical protein
MWLNYGQRVLPLEAIDARLLVGLTTVEPPAAGRMATRVQPAAPHN